MVYGPTQAAVAKAILDNVEKGVIPERALDEKVILFKATIHPQALDRHLLYQNVYRATDEALKGALRRGA
jgi:5,6,7,8-tetrahydromethanopterin hydro-lyase